MIVILDNGHGGIHPTTNQYVTAGKRSPKFDDGSVLYEGVNNRDNVVRIIDGLELEGIECVNLVNTWRDIPLRERVSDVNELCKDNDCILISIHSDAHINEWSTANGIGTWVYNNASFKTSQLADSLNNSLICEFDGVAKNRGIRKANFYMLKQTRCPAVLLELGFHTNKEEAKRMLTEVWKQKIVDSIVEAVKEYIKKTQ